MSTELHVVFGTGAVGQAVIRELRVRGHRVRAVSHSGRAGLDSDVEKLSGDAGDPAFANRACTGASVVYSALNPPYHQWPELFPRLQAGVLSGAASVGARLVAIENLYGYGPTGGRPLTENLPLAATTRKGATRAAMTAQLLDAHRRGIVQVSIGRASDFFGPGVLNSAMGTSVFDSVLARKPVRVLGNPDLPHTYSYINDIGRGLVTLADDSRACGQMWHLPNPETLTTRQFIQRIGCHAGVPVHMERTPRLALAAVGLFNPTVRELVEMLYEFEQPFAVDDSKYVRTFGPGATQIDEALQHTLRWYSERRAARRSR
jgi:nucleoside-diphosphate-sugar epimerase